MNVSNEDKIWRLVVAADRHIGLTPSSLTYFQANFIGSRLLPDWRAPEFLFTNKSKPWADFLSWMIAAPVVSEKAVKAFSAFSNVVEFLPLFELRKKKYYAMNVVAVERNILDLGASKIDYQSPNGAPLILRTAVFRAVPPSPIFKVAISDKNAFPDIFVTRPFADILIQEGLTGCLLTDTKVDDFEASLLGLRRKNVVPGIKT